MKEKLSYHLIGMVFLLSSLLSPAYGYQEPEAQLRPMIVGIVEVLGESNSTTATGPTKQDRIMEIASKGFDFHEMSRRVLGRQWKKLSVVQREEFVEIFTQLLKITYVSQIDKFTNQAIIFGKQRIKGNRAQVQTFLTDGERQVSMSYIMIRKGELWKIYDIVVEGVSLVRNYLAQFRELLRKDTFDGLNNQLKLKIAEFEKKETAG